MAGPTVTTLAVDRIVCDGYGICAELLPELIDLDDWGYPIVSAEPVHPSLRDHAQRAVAMCPVLALSLRSAQGPPAAPALRQGSPARLAGADRSIRRPRPGFSDAGSGSRIWSTARTNMAPAVIPKSPRLTQKIGRATARLVLLVSRLGMSPR